MLAAMSPRNSWRHGNLNHKDKGSQSPETDCGHRTSPQLHLLFSATRREGEKLSSGQQQVAGSSHGNFDANTHGVKGFTLFPSTGESGANHISCISDWQCAKHEFMNNPLLEELPCSSSAFRKSSLNPAIARHVLIKCTKNRFPVDRSVKHGSTYPVRS